MNQLRDRSPVLKDKKIKTIDTLVTDIESLIESGILEAAETRKFADELYQVINERLNREAREPTLRMSSISQPCERKLYYEINSPGDGEVFKSATYLKFLYGDIIESLLLFLAERAGHKVTGRQDVLEVAGIKGHRDGVINGLLIDCKSASSFSFQKFKQHLRPEDDSFGYLGQLRAYLLASKDDPLVENKSQAGFLVIDKTLGHITLDIHNFDTTFDLVGEFERKKHLVVQDNPPERGFKPEAYGSSGNESLSLNCSYCPFKFKCYDGLRVFNYSHKPIFLSTVKLLPKVEEITGSFSGTID